MSFIKCMDMKEIDRNLFFEPGMKEDVQLWTIKDSLPSGPFMVEMLYEEEVCLVLETRISLYGVAAHQLFIWVGSKAKEQDVSHATRHAATLDLMLRRRITVHLEHQYQECQNFMATFGTMYYMTGRRKEYSRSKSPKIENKLYAIYSRGKYCDVRPVECAMSSLNRQDSLVLVTERLKTYQLPRGLIPDRVQRIAYTIHFREWFESLEESLDLENRVLLDKDAMPEDWDDFYKTLGWDDINSFPVIPEGERREDQSRQPAYKLYEILRNRKGDIYYKYMNVPVQKDDLNSKSLYILSNGQNDINLWVGKKNEDRNKAKLYGVAKIQEFMTHFKLPSCAHMTIIPEGLEPLYFKEQFKNWI